MGTSVSAAPTVVRTKNFVADAATFILEQARKAIAERSEFRIALSGGNTPAPVYARVAMEAHDLSFDSPLEMSVACRRMIRKATFEWREKIFLCLLPFLRNQSCVCVAKLIRKSQRRSTNNNWTPSPPGAVSQFINTI
jgi:hypothetical protein